MSTSTRSWRPRPLALVASGLALLVGCSTVDYVGERHPPTRRVRVVYSRRDLPAGYRVMGRAVAHTPSGLTGGDLYAAIVDKAKSVGADAVVLGRFSRVRSSARLLWWDDEFGRPWDDDDDWDWPDPAWGPRGQYFGPGWSSPEVVYDSSLQLEATFLRREPGRPKGARS
jgi:hypothetical protein